MKWLLPLLLLFAACSAPVNPSFGGSQWARTQIAMEAPAFATTTSTGAFVIRSVNDNTAKAFPLPLQFKLTVTGTTGGILCASKDPSPIISRLGRFTADSAGYYAAGGGPCHPVGTADFAGWTAGAWLDGSRTILPGSKPYSCSVSLTPCSVASDCPSGGGTCTTYVPSNYVYLFFVCDAGSGCEIKGMDAR